MDTDTTRNFELNEEQYAAVTAPDGPVLVLAAAGTGKTRTLVYRVAHLVNRGVDPSNILLLTFTNKAAQEMLVRATQLVGPGIGGIWAGTFHHMANRILRRHAGCLGYPNDYVILDRDDSLKMVRNCIKERGIEQKDFPAPKVLLSLFSASLNTGENIESILDQRFSRSDVNVSEVLRVYKDYFARKEQSCAMDFDDLLCKCLDLLLCNEEIMSLYKQRFQHVLVDEYQDTNIVQSQLIDLLSADSNNLFVVGDDFQSIYSWRGADFRHMLSFPERYRDARTYKLETNYRSCPEVLEVANACIAGNKEQFSKRLRATRESNRRPSMFRLRDGAEQAMEILRKIRMLRRDGYRYCDMAVLYRAHYHAMELQMQLTRDGVPFVITSGMRFFEQAHIKDVCSILRMLQNPSDESAFMRCFMMFAGVGTVTAARIWRDFGCRIDLSEPAVLQKLRQSMPRRALDQWEGVESVVIMALEDGLLDDPGRIIQAFTDTLYEGYCLKTFEDALSRLDDIQEMVTYTNQFQNTQAFLSEVSLMTNLEAAEEKAGTGDKDALRLSTIHQAKGLEWPVVIIPWVVEGMFPSSRAMEEGGSGEAEERRLFYVAVTRARDEVCFFVPQVQRRRDGGLRALETSRFLQELPVELVEEDEDVPAFV